jgi:threonine aldolase
MANQLGLKVLTSPGQEVIIGRKSHIFNYEAGGPSLLSGLQLNTVDDNGGALQQREVELAIRGTDYHMPVTSVIAQEISHNRESGSIADMEHVEALYQLGRERGISLHLDGARLWNAMAANGVDPKEYGRLTDTIAVCLSKGLGAPIGSLMLGTEKQIDIAWRFRKIWGGGWRQAGILAAAGLHALDHHRDRLVDDHRHALMFHDALCDLDPLSFIRRPRTNIVVFESPTLDVKELSDRCKREGLLLSTAFAGQLRAVFHLDISDNDVITAIDVVRGCVEQMQAESSEMSRTM